MIKRTSKNPYLLITQDYPPPFVGGSAVYLYNLVEHSGAGFDILTSTLPDGMNEVSSENYNLLRTGFITPSRKPTRRQILVNYLYIFVWLFLQCFMRRYRVVVVSLGVLGNGAAIFAARLFRVPVVVVSYAEEITMSLKGKGARRVIRQAILRHAYKKAGGFVSVCEFVKNILVSLGISEEKITVIPPMLTRQKSAGITRKANQEMHVLSIGRLSARKGFSYLLEAVNLLKADCPELRLTVVGYGAERKNLEALIRKYNLENNACLKGEISDEELCCLLEKSTLFVLANVMLENGDCEGCPTVLIEASACGIPAIGGVEGGASSAIDDGVTGFLVNPRDIHALSQKIKMLLLDPELAQSMGAAGIEKVKRDHDPAKNGIRFYEFISRIENGREISEHRNPQPMQTG